MVWTLYTADHLSFSDLVSDANYHSLDVEPHLEDVQADRAAYDVYVWVVARCVEPDYGCCIWVVRRKRDGDLKSEASVYLNETMSVRIQRVV